MTAISTPDNNEYEIRSLKGRGCCEETLTFDVKCRNDAHIALLSSDSVAPPMIEVFIGGWRNQKSAIRFNQSKPDKADAATPDIVSEEEFRRFWIRYSPHSIQVGTEGEDAPFLCWEHSEEPFRITHFGIATGWGATGSWIIEDDDKASSDEDDDPVKIRQRGRKPFYKRPAVWMDPADGQAPLRAVIGGLDITGEKLYVGRMKHEDGSLLAGKIVPSHNTCYVACDGAEHGCAKFQYLVRNKHCELIWVAARDGEIPNGALQGGLTAEGEPTFIARAVHDGITSIGMVHPSRGLCVCPYGGQAIPVIDYEVLVVKYLPL